MRCPLRISAAVVTVTLAAAAVGCGRAEDTSNHQETAPRVRAPDIVAPPPFDALTRPYMLDGPLVPASVTMISAWDIPQNPMTDPALEGSVQRDTVQRGYRLFVDTPREAPHLTPSQMSCGNCHLNAGQRDRALPLVGSAGMFPEYNRRAGRDFTLEDRIVGCFLRSENATGASVTAATDARELPTPDSDEVLALAAYIRWLSASYASGENPPWRKQNQIPADKLIPIDDLDPGEGELLFVEHCATCHGEDGQGVQIADKKAGPLWGPNSWNDGAGVARTYTLAGFIRYAMPYLNPGVLSDEEAQHIAAFITSQPRPAYPHKGDDYLTEPRPVDAVYYRP